MLTAADPERASVTANSRPSDVETRPGAPLPAPAIAEEFVRLVSRVWELAPDPTLLELCRIHAAMLLGTPDVQRSWGSRRLTAPPPPQQVAALADWPDSPQFDERERAYLDFAEQFVTSVNHVSDEQVAALCALDGDVAVSRFVAALYVLELALRVELVAAAVLPDRQLLR